MMGPSSLSPVTPGGIGLPRELRRRMEEAIERLIAILDTLDGDPEAEQTSPERFGAGFVPCSMDDLDEQDDAEGNDPDIEHTLGWSEDESRGGHLTSTDIDTQEEFA